MAAHGKEASQFSPVLIATQHRADANLLAEQLRGFDSSITTIWAQTVEGALAAAEKQSLRLLFVEHSADGLAGLRMVKALRHSDWPCREAPVIMMVVQPTLQVMREAQNAGAHELLVRPFSAAQLGKRLQALAAPRLWVETASYVGPDRRRFNSAALLGPDRRRRRPSAG